MCPPPLLHCPPLQTKNNFWDMNWDYSVSTAKKINKIPRCPNRSRREVDATQVTSYILYKIAKPKDTRIHWLMQLLVLGTPTAIAVVLLTLAVKAAMLVAVHQTLSHRFRVISFTMIHWLWLKGNNRLRECSFENILWSFYSERVRCSPGHVLQLSKQELSWDVTSRSAPNMV